MVGAKCASTLQPMKLADSTIVSDTEYEGDRSHQSTALWWRQLLLLGMCSGTRRAGRTLQAREGLQETRLPFNCRWMWGKERVALPTGSSTQKVARCDQPASSETRQIDTTTAAPDSNFGLQLHTQHIQTFDIAVLVVNSA